jgi:hypothetical protein
MLVEADSPLNRGVPQHVGSKPYTSIDAASDAEVLGDIPIDPYVGTALGTLREAYCAQNSDLPSAAVADALAWVECETRNRLSKDYMLTGSLVCKCMRVLNAVPSDLRSSLAHYCCNHLSSLCFPLIF